MSLQIQVPPGRVSGGGVICVTITGTPGQPAPTVIVLEDGETPIPVLGVEPMGNGSWLVCFKIPTGCRSVEVNAALPTGGAADLATVAISVG